MTQSNGMQGRFPEYFATTVLSLFCIARCIYVSHYTLLFGYLFKYETNKKKTFTFIFKAVLNAHYKLLFLVPEI